MADESDPLTMAVLGFDIPDCTALWQPERTSTRDEFGEPALFNAVFAMSHYDQVTKANGRRYDVITALIDLGADPCQLADDGASILIGPIFSQDTAMVALLLARGVDPNQGCGEPWETVYELALFDYCHEAGLVFGKQDDEPPAPDDAEGEEAYLVHLDRRAEAKGNRGPEIPRLLRRYGALSNSEMSRKLGSDRSGRIHWRNGRWHLHEDLEPNAPG